MFKKLKENTLLFSFLLTIGLIVVSGLCTLAIGSVLYGIALLIGIITGISATSLIFNGLLCMIAFLLIWQVVNYALFLEKEND